MLLSLFDYIPGGQPLECRLVQQATSRLSQAFAESTNRVYATMFRTFVAFVIFMSWDIYQVTVLQLLCFLECLQYNDILSNGKLSLCN